MTINEPGPSDSSTGEAPAGGFTPGPPVIHGWTVDAPVAVAREALVNAVPAALGRQLLVAAIAIGIVFQLLFVGQGNGVNAMIWTAVLLGSAAAVRRPDTTFDLADAWLPPAALVAALFLALRADPALVAFDVLAMLALTGAAVASLAGIAVTRRSVGGLLGLFVRGGVVATTGATGLGPGARSLAQDANGLPGARVRRVAAGLLIALPIVGVFTLLFAQADAVFSRALSDAFSWQFNLGVLPVQMAFAAFGAWVGAGMLVLIVAAGRRIHTDEPFVPPARLGGIEATVALLAIDALFAVFVALQAAYLFGGRDTLAAAGLTYSEYAHRGFWELVTVAALVGGLICVLEAVVRDRGRAYRSASLMLVALTAVVLASAAFRLGMYQQAYGWTELRFYVVTAIVWLGFCLLAAAVTLATNRSRWLPHAAVLLGLVVAVGANVVGPQSFVVTQNVARAVDPSQIAAGGRPGLDAQYLGGLGDGAVPVLLDALPRLSPADRATVAAALVARRDAILQQSPDQGWPSWNLAREEARSRLENAVLP
jgi:Domain of unknown function (DUF4173)